LGAKPGDVAVGLQPFQADLTRRFRQPNLRGKGGHRDPAIGSENIENRMIKLVEWCVFFRHSYSFA